MESASVKTPRRDAGADDLSLPQVGQRRNLRQEITVALRAALVTGEMRPGVLYSAPTLAEKFGVSATPVREAMLDLAGEGLVEPVRNKGFRVSELSEKDLDEITYLRQLIEVPAVGDVASAMDDAMRPRAEALRPMARTIVRLATERDLLAYVEADRQFHLALLELTGNRHLVDLVANLRARSRLYGLQQLADRGELGRSAAEHEEIVELVVHGRAAEAADLMRRHIQHVRGVWAGYQEPMN
ncbi:GntR family transcriptional regulator [Blastococcus capsensis]|uniref:GntR family transcriptional regulator n=1 Tax=Blastococcus capsensis TaxID=1564163 RepID=UPI002541F163|nr:GntR family transcriptional regulator [Blastococcus capsensis]MDK3258256.1 GntR family transcriptional regulator [Blastococcus capsensis]